ncbi:ANTAR domain-containing protein [Streptomyces sp. Ag109_G2-6]|uniref:SpoIIE family protein phosphatase n=1 Tax=Streptomyces TaxID=1883 RepID=UPI0009A4F5DF|nr:MULTISPECIES: SpoIIE family protein phosphatase [Streptomyces]RPF44433.1 ANTAR domain-containing protein [Streptomyces sp. Ag109_G2-6]
MAQPESGLASTVADLTAEVAALHADRARRSLLDLACGVLMAQLSVPPAEANDHLLRLAVSTGLSATDLAADIVNAAIGPDAVHGSGPGAAEVAVPTAEARRIRRGTTAVLTSDTADAAASALLEGGLRRLGIESVYLWRRTETDCLELAGHAGAPPLEATHWRWVPPETEGPLHRTLTMGLPTWFPDGPGAEGRLPGPRAEAARGLVPLHRSGQSAGLALVVWPGPRGLDDTVRATVAALCRPAGQVLDLRDHGPAAPPRLTAVLSELVMPAMLVSVTVPAGGQAVGFGRAHTVDYLNPAAVRYLGSLPAPVGRPVAQLFPSVYEELVGLLARANATGAPQYAPVLPAAPPNARPAKAGTAAAEHAMAEVRVLPLGGGRTAVMWHADDRRGPPLTRALARLEQLAVFEEDLAAGTTVWSAHAYPVFGLHPEDPAVPLRNLGARLHPQDRARLEGLLASLTDRHAGGQVLVRAVRPGGGVRRVRVAAEPVLTGSALTGIVGVFQDVSAQHHTEVALTATYDQLSAARIEAELRDHLVLGLQHAIVPEAPALENPPGLRVAARYRPAAAEYRVGGDWYDVQSLPDGKVLVTVGDIAGHGIDSATAMIALRGALHGLAFTGNTPGRLMEWLNEVALRTPGQPTATAVCALFDPADRSLHWCGAGHPPVLLLRGGRARFLEGMHNILLGALPGAGYGETVTELRSDDTLLLYTDGFVERRHVGLDESLEVLRRAVERLRPEPAEELADRLMSAVLGDTDDDTSLVVVRVT